jgi:aspartate racemase
MKTLGIVGGIAPGSTVDYYRQVIAEYRARTGGIAYPSVVINSIDLTRLLALMGAGALDELTEWLGEEVRRLERAEAAVGLLASNTPHAVFDAVARQSPIPLVSIVESAARAARTQGLRSLALLGTRFTMLGSFYPDVFARHGLAVMIPEPADVEYVHERYVNELIPGVLLPETRAQVLRIIRRMVAGGADGVLLAGTELPPLFDRMEVDGLPLLDTTRIHVSAAVDALLA